MNVTFQMIEFYILKYEQKVLKVNRMNDFYSKVVVRRFIYSDEGDRPNKCKSEFIK